MRRVLLAVLLVAAVVGCGGHAATPVLRVSIGPASPFADPEDTYNFLGNRSWGVTPTIRVRLHRSCGDISVRSSSRAFFDGNPFTRGKDVGGTAADDFGRHRAGHVYKVEDEADADAGDTVRMQVTATCWRSKHEHARATAVRSFSLPTASCDSGPLRVTELAGSATRSDDNYEGRSVPLQRGDLVGHDAEVKVAGGGRVVLDAPECNSFQVTLFPGLYSAGSYERDGRGYSFSGPRIVETGDRHAGGFSVEGRADFLPLNAICPGCAPQPSMFEVRSGDGARSRATLRVATGAVVVKTSDRRLWVGGGYQADVVCARRVACRILGPRLFQPGEAWATPPFPKPSRFGAPFTTPISAQPTPAQLAPPRSHVDEKVLRATGGAPEQIVLIWSRETRLHGGTRAGDLTEEEGALIWQATRVGDRKRWAIVVHRPFLGAEPAGFTTGDVTGDGHPDVLFEQEMGSGGCGPHTLVATVHSRARVIFRRYTCETIMRLKDGAFVVDGPVGPCPYKEASVHCFGGTRHTVWRWNGKRLAAASVKVTCALPRLDPAANCARNRKDR